MATMGWVVTIIPILAAALAMCWGSVLAFRGRKWWATWCMLLGAGVALLGSLLGIAGQAIMFSRMYSGAGGSASSVAEQIVPIVAMMGIGGVAVAGGGLAFAIGFLGFCARSGATEQRAMELEAMVGRVQARLPEEQR